MGEVRAPRADPDRRGATVSDREVGGTESVLRKACRQDVDSSPAPVLRSSRRAWKIAETVGSSADVGNDVSGPCRPVEPGVFASRPEWSPGARAAVQRFGTILGTPRRCVPRGGERVSWIAARTASSSPRNSPPPRTITARPLPAGEQGTICGPLESRVPALRGSAAWVLHLEVERAQLRPRVAHRSSGVPRIAPGRSRGPDRKPPRRGSRAAGPRGHT